MALFLVPLSSVLESDVDKRIKTAFEAFDYESNNMVDVRWAQFSMSQTKWFIHDDNNTTIHWPTPANCKLLGARLRSRVSSNMANKDGKQMLSTKCFGSILQNILRWILLASCRLIPFFNNFANMILFLFFQYIWVMHLLKSMLPTCWFWPLSSHISNVCAEHT